LRPDQKKEKENFAMLNRRNFFTGLTAAAAVPAAAMMLSRKTATAAVVRAAGAEKPANQIVHAVGMGRLNIPNVQVTNQEGRKYHFYNDLVKDKIVMINFFYANCTGICPRMTSNLLKIQKSLAEHMGKSMFIYSISLKPEQDSPKNLKDYAGMHGIKPGSGWMLLNAQRADMETLRERLGFKDSDPALDADVDQHTGILRFGTDIYDHWSGYPLLGKAETIAEMVRQLDPNIPRRPLFL
jgi:protein SCO1/2